MNKICLITTDVETTNIQKNCLDDNVISPICQNGMPLLLEMYNKFNISGTFFFTGYIAKKKPDLVRMVCDAGHEIGSHGLMHVPEKSFDVMSQSEQLSHLKESKKILEDISGTEVISFRAPALRVNKYTPLALEESGFKIDSSISSQRFDMFMSFGGLKKLKWLLAPRLPYRTHKNDLSKKGDSSILEIPISALIFPYICTTLRIFPHLTKFIRIILYIESLISSKPIVFLTHPNEFINISGDFRKTTRRSKNVIQFILADVIRRKLKLKNLGFGASHLLSNELKFFKNKKFIFLSLKDYYKRTNVTVN